MLSALWSMRAILPSILDRGCSDKYRHEPLCCTRHTHIGSALPPRVSGRSSGVGVLDVRASASKARGRGFGYVAHRSLGRSVQQLLTIAKGLLIVAVVSVGLLYACDYLLVRYRMARPKMGNALGSVKIQRTYAIPRKDGKVEFVFGEPETQVCVRSVFPHLGYSPCWYASRRNLKPIPMVIFLLPSPAGAGEW
jgi:hypothetical protein